MNDCNYAVSKKLIIKDWRWFYFARSLLIECHCHCWSYVKLYILERELYFDDPILNASLNVDTANPNLLNRFDDKFQIIIYPKDLHLSRNSKYKMTYLLKIIMINLSDLIIHQHMFCKYITMTKEIQWTKKKIETITLKTGKHKTENSIFVHCLINSKKYIILSIRFW